MVGQWQDQVLNSGPARAQSKCQPKPNGRRDRAQFNRRNEMANGKSNGTTYLAMGISNLIRIYHGIALGIEMGIRVRSGRRRS